MTFSLDAENAAGYLRSQGLLEPDAPASAEVLGGGISNVLVKVITPDDCLVVKQSLPKLRVDEDWFADRERIFREWECIDTLSQVLPLGTIPKVRHRDRENFLFVMSCAPAGGVNWKKQLLNGETDAVVAEKVGAALGAMHSTTAKMAAVKSLFLDDRAFVQLRIDPYHRAAARVHPDVAAAIQREAQRMLGVKIALVHGDYSPKNVIVTGQDIFLVDFEVAHYGNPVFDLAFMFNHLLLKAMHNRHIKSRYFGLAEAFWRGYQTGRAESGWARNTAAQVGCLMLARIDGKSPAEYIVDPAAKDLARRVAKKLLTGGVSTLDGMLQLVDAEITRDTRLFGRRRA
jgi:5-methylthioribose kinase